MLSLKFQKFLPQGRAVWTIFQDSVPLWLTLASGMMIAFNDMQIAGRLGPSAQAAMGLCETIWYLFTLVATGIAGGTGTCIAQALGAGNRERARKFAFNGIVAAAATGAVLFVATLFLAEYLCSNLCGSSRVSEQAVSYLRLCAWGNLPFAIMQTQSAIFRSVGRPRLSLCLWLIAAALEILGTQYSYSSYSGLALKDLNFVAVQWNIACLASTVLGFVALSRMRDEIPRPNADLMHDFSLAMSRRIMEVGLPLVCGESAVVIAQLFIYKLLGELPDGVHWQAIWAIKSRVEESAALSPLVALSLALATRTAFEIGAGRKYKAMKTAWLCAIAGSSLMAIVGACVFCLAPHIVALCAGASELVLDGSYVLSAAALLWPLLALATVLLGAFEGIARPCLR